MAIDWRAMNLANWESRVPLHIGPGGYDLAAFADPTYRTTVVRYDEPRLGGLDGLDVVHLQCHIGTDTVSLARLGARSVVGLDFSPAALEVGRELAAATDSAVTFVEGDVYDAVEQLGAASFDLVYTGIGAICWLPSIERWAGVVAGLLRPGGRLFIRDGHPMMLALGDTRPDGLLVVDYPYFEGAGTVFTEEVSYSGMGTVAAPDSMAFSHGIGEMFSALIAAGLTITSFEEHREVPWNALGDAMRPSPDLPGEWVLADRPERLPLTFTLQAVKYPD